MATKIDIEELILKLENIKYKCTDMSQVMKKISRKMATKIRMNLKKEIDPTGNPWVKSQRAIRDNGQTLAKTGRLKSSITSKHTGTRAAAGTNVKYARLLHFGAKKGAFGGGIVAQKVGQFTRTRKGKREQVKSHTRMRYISFPFGNIPSRKFLGMTIEDREKYLKLIKEYLTK